MPFTGLNKYFKGGLNLNGRMRYTCRDLGAQPQTLNGTCYEPNEATVEAFFATTRNPPVQQLLLSNPLFKRFSC